VIPAAFEQRVSQDGQACVNATLPSILTPKVSSQSHSMETLLPRLPLMTNHLTGQRSGWSAIDEIYPLENPLLALKSSGANNLCSLLGQM